MAGYAASARLHGAAPQFAFVRDRAHRAMALAAIAAPSNGESLGDAVQLELIGQPIDEVIGDWLASVGEAWSQLTFFVFDPESWR